MINKLISFSKDKESLNHLLNHLFIIYLFSFPISHAHKSIFILIVLIFIIRGNFKKYFLYALSNPIIQALTLFGLIHILWMFVSEDITYTKSIVRSSLYYFYPIIFITFLDYRYLSRYLFTFFLSMLFSELFSYGLHFGLLPAQWGFYNNPLDPSPFYHHTHYGMALAFTLSIIFYDLVTKREQKYITLVLSLFFITASINLFINGGRTGYILYFLLLMSMGFWFIKKHSYKLFAFIIPVILTAFVLAYNYSPAFQKRLQDTQYEITTLIESRNFSSSFGSRVGAWTYSIPIIEEHLIFGVGTGNQLKEVGKYVNAHDSKYYKTFTNGHMVHLHNQYISVLIQFGLIGLSIYLFLLYRLFTYKQENHLLKTTQVFLTLSIVFFGVIDIITESSALVILLFTALIPVTLLKPSDTPLQTIYPITMRRVFYYLIFIILFYVIKKFT